MHKTKVHSPNKKYGGAQEGKQIVSQGQMPWNVVKADLRVEIRNPSLTRATVCDANGYPVRQLAVDETSNGITFRFPEDALYVVLR